MRRLHIVSLYDQLPYVERGTRAYATEHLRHPVVVRGIMSRFGGRDRNKRQRAQVCIAENAADGYCCLRDRARLVWPLWRPAEAHILLQIKDQIVGRAMLEASAGRVLADECTRVGLFEIAVTRARQLVYQGCPFRKVRA